MFETVASFSTGNNAFSFATACSWVTLASAGSGVSAFVWAAFAGASCTVVLEVEAAAEANPPGSIKATATEVIKAAFAVCPIKGFLSLLKISPPKSFVSLDFLAFFVQNLLRKHRPKFC
ncbi:hypothetical protein D3C80_1229000 [compost metagenome]